MASRTIPSDFFDAESVGAPTEEPTLGAFLAEIKSTEAEASEEALAEADEEAADEVDEGVVHYAFLNKVARLHRKRAGEEDLEEADDAELEHVLEVDDPKTESVEDTVVKALVKRRKADAPKVTEEVSLLAFSF